MIYVLTNLIFSIFLSLCLFIVNIFGLTGYHNKPKTESFDSYFKSFMREMKMIDGSNHQKDEKKIIGTNLKIVLLKKERSWTYHKYV